MLGSVQFWAWVIATLALIPVYHPSIFQPIGVGVLNGSLWTIPVECSFYAIVPSLAFAARRFSAARMLVGLAVLAGSGLAIDGLLKARWGDSLAYKLLGVTFLPHLLFFAFGIFWMAAWPRTPRSGWLAFTCVIIYGGVRWSLPINGLLATHVLAPVWGFALSYLALWVGYQGPRVLACITARMGDLSYGVYIWHMVVINLVLYYGRIVRGGPIADTGFVCRHRFRRPEPVDHPRHCVRLLASC